MVQSIKACTPREEMCSGAMAAALRCEPAIASSNPGIALGARVVFFLKNPGRALFTKPGMDA